MRFEIHIPEKGSGQKSEVLVDGRALDLSRVKSIAISPLNGHDLPVISVHYYADSIDVTADGELEMTARSKS